MNTGIRPHNLTAAQAVRKIVDDPALIALVLSSVMLGCFIEALTVDRTSHGLSWSDPLSSLVGYWIGYLGALVAIVGGHGLVLFRLAAGRWRWCGWVLGVSAAVLGFLLVLASLDDLLVGGLPWLIAGVLICGCGAGVFRILHLTTADTRTVVNPWTIPADAPPPPPAPVVTPDLSHNQDPEVTS